MPASAGSGSRFERRASPAVTFSARRANHPRKPSSPRIENISLYQNSDLRYPFASPRHREGRFAIVTERGAGCDGRVRRQAGLFPAGRKRRRVRRSRVVLAPRPWRYVGGNHPAGNGGKKGRSPGRSRISRKAIARGKPGCLGCTCQIRVRFSSTHCTRRCGRSRRPAFPAPSLFGEGQRIGKAQVESHRENEPACFPVVARSQGDEAIHRPPGTDGIASLRLQ